MTVEDLLEIERIRKLRVLYSYYLDAGEFDALAALFCEDAVCEFGPFGVWTGRATIAGGHEHRAREQYQSVRILVMGTDHL